MRLFRCTKCEKWSHAQRMPKSHKRWVYYGEPEFDELKSEGVSYDYAGNEIGTEGHFVDCGPFETWYAVREDKLTDALTIGV